MNQTAGYIKLYRTVSEHPVYQDRERFCKRAAWIDILLSVNYSEQEVMIGNAVLKCGPGQCLYSLETWARRWNWENKMQVRRFFDLLERMEMIRTENVTKTLRLTVCNWASYQGNGYAPVTAADAPPPPNFDLLKKIGAPAAKLWTEGNAGQAFDSPDHAALALAWMEYRCQTGRPLQSHQELMQLYRLFKGKPTADIKAVMEYSMSAGYPALYFDRLEKTKKKNGKHPEGPAVLDPSIYDKYRNK